MAEKDFEFERLFTYLFIFENITFVGLFSQCHGLLYVFLFRMLGLYLIHMIRLKRDLNTFCFLGTTSGICTLSYFSIKKNLEKISLISISLEN